MTVIHKPQAKVTLHRPLFLVGTYTGDQIPGFGTDKALGYIYLQHIRNQGGKNHGLLQKIALDIMSTGTESDKKKSLVLGISYLLERWFADMDKKDGEYLDRPTPDDLLIRASDGLKGKTPSLILKG
ncbi:hypothetical protein [Neptunomonas qingdaonensis]|uniref:Uncharacterized protein n=1 Tax=Neptunomonas qingdaonensis TaxID=1045558 RepID=A0A1I2N1Y9_9GAMM|nr:hypothetical protein [Neptunomonas qingdaonensis]SFF97874.1 hypothetical protein SAMN05216175_102249 [Neptunomonas qingdaonensis]